MPIHRWVPCARSLMAAAGTIVLAGGSMLLGQGQTGGVSAGSPAVSPDTVVLSVGEKKFTAAEFEKLLTALPPQFQAIVASSGTKGLAEQFGTIFALAMEGEKRQLQDTDTFLQMMELDRQAMLATYTYNVLLREYAAVGDEEISYYYETNRPEFEQVKVTGIYIPFSTSSAVRGTASAMPALTEQQAQRKAMELRARINSGQNMAALARTESQHPTASKGGDFGYLSRGSTQLPQPIVNAIFMLQERTVSAPLKDSGGYYLFLSEEKRTQPLEEIKQIIQTRLAIMKLNRRLEMLKESYPVEMHPTYFSGPRSAAPGSPPRP